MQGCDVPTYVPHATYSPTILQTPVQAGTTIQYSCDNGYVLQGRQTIQCHSSGMWLPSTPPVCIPIERHTVFCDDPGKPEHGRRCCQKVFYPSMKLNYYCDEGYYLRGSEERMCQTDSSWTGVQPICVPVGTSTPDIPDGDSQFWNNDTMTIVTATIGSILGVLIVTVILTSRHCQSRRNHAYHRVLRARLSRMPEADTAALLAVAENINVVLPSYEEATASNTSARPPPPFDDTSNPTTNPSRLAQRTVRDPMHGRPLPPVPSDDSITSSSRGSQNASQQTMSVNTEQQTEDAALLQSSQRADMGVGTEDSEMQEMMTTRTGDGSASDTVANASETQEMGTRPSTTEAPVSSSAQTGIEASDMQEMSTRPTETEASAFLSAQVEQGCDSGSLDVSNEDPSQED
ncbi:uncharacterized protein [Amphiura filiformis]|uniref:uncharacterized protein n=1 Tax=Amphiura filiformis TaxID=82378 RepID=UPI003B2190EE